MKFLKYLSAALFLISAVAHAGSRLWNEISLGHLAQARQLIESGADVNERNDLGAPILLHAVFDGDAELVKLMLSKGADVNAMGLHRTTALHLANKKGMAAVLLAYGAKVDAATDNGETPLHWAAKRVNELGRQVDSLEFARVLIEHGADVNKEAKSLMNATPLNLAAASNNIPVATLLLEHGANVLGGKEGVPALISACASPDSVEMVRLIVAHGGKINGFSRHDFSPLMTAAHWGHLKIAEFLLSQGADPNLANRVGFTPLYMAAGSDYNYATAEALIRHGANPNAVTIHGFTALHQAAARSIKVAGLLLANGADANIADKHGDTALHEAVKYASRELDMVELLLKHGANPNLRDSHEGVSPFHKALHTGDVSIVKLMLAYGADVSITTRSGGSALSHARESEAIKELLRAHGAK